MSKTKIKQGWAEWWKEEKHKPTMQQGSEHTPWHHAAYSLGYDLNALISWLQVPSAELSPDVCLTDGLIYKHNIEGSIMSLY